MQALIMVDIQNDFLPGGSLAVPEGDQIIPLANRLQKQFDLVVATQDWHPATHGSFAANQPGKKPGEIIDLNGFSQILWPVHCVQGSIGAAFADDLDLEKISKVFKKGTDMNIDSYSGFFDNGQRKATGLEDYLKQMGVERVYIVGLATDYCVKFTALDSQRAGFDTTVIKDATRAVNLELEDYQKALSEMKKQGIKVDESNTILQQQIP